MRQRDYGCERPRTSRRRAAPQVLDLLLRERAIYVGCLCGRSAGLWRVAVPGGERELIAAPTERADEGGARLLWAASALLEHALGRATDDASARGLAEDLARTGVRRLVLSDVEVRLWFLRWRALSGE